MSVSSGAKSSSGSAFTTRRIVFTGASIAIAFALSYVKLFRFPWGGSVTLCSMLFVSVVGWFYGPVIGFSAALLYSALQFIQGGSYILSPLQVCLDYFVAFTALGISGFFANRKNGLTTGYCLGILLRGAFHAIGGYLYWMEYIPDNFPKSLASVYPIVYNYAYILAEGVITVVLLSLPPVKNALAQVKRMATE